MAPFLVNGVALGPPIGHRPPATGDGLGGQRWGAHGTAHSLPFLAPLNCFRPRRPSVSKELEVTLFPPGTCTRSGARASPKEPRRGRFMNIVSALRIASGQLHDSMMIQIRRRRHRLAFERPAREAREPLASRRRRDGESAPAPARRITPLLATTQTHPPLGRLRQRSSMGSHRPSSRPARCPESAFCCVRLCKHRRPHPRLFQEGRFRRAAAPSQTDVLIELLRRGARLESGQAPAFLFSPELIWRKMLSEVRVCVCVFGVERSL